MQVRAHLVELGGSHATAAAAHEARARLTRSLLERIRMGAAALAAAAASPPDPVGAAGGCAQPESPMESPTERGLLEESDGSARLGSPNATAELSPIVEGTEVDSSGRTDGALRDLPRLCVDARRGGLLRCGVLEQLLPLLRVDLVLLRRGAEAVGGEAQRVLRVVPRCGRVCAMRTNVPRGVPSYVTT